MDEFKEQGTKAIVQPDEPQTVKVAIVGSPNVGKSTLLNQLIEWKVSAVSRKVHTTRANIVGVFVQDNTQVEFVDTPGMVNRKHIARHHLAENFIGDVQYGFSRADVIAVLVDVSNIRERRQLNSGIINLLAKNRDKNAILVLNKVDKVRRKRELLDITNKLTDGQVDGEKIVKHPVRRINKDSLEYLFKKTEHHLQYKDNEVDEEQQPIKYTCWPHFNRVFMISALHNEGIDELRQYFLSKARPGLWRYPDERITSQNPQSIIIDCLREVCLEMFRQEIPYNFYFQIIMWEVDSMNTLHILVDMYCPEKFTSLVIGPKGTTIAAIVRKARESLSTTFRCDVNLKIAAKSKK